MPFSLACPKCGKSYTLDEKHAGRKVACLRKTCGETFIANLPDEPATENDDDLFFEGVAESAELPPLPSKKPPKLPSVDTHSDSDEVVRDSVRCYLSSIGPILFFVGFSAIVAAVGLPCTIDRPASGSGAFEMPGGSFFNMPLAMTKLGTFLFGTPLMISGAAFWAAGKRPPGLLAFVLVMLELAAAVLVGLFQLLGPTN